MTVDVDGASVGVYSPEGKIILSFLLYFMFLKKDGQKLTKMCVWGGVYE